MTQNSGTTGTTDFVIRISQKSILRLSKFEPFVDRLTLRQVTVAMAYKKKAANSSVDVNRGVGYLIYLHIGVSKNSGTPKWMV